MRLVPGLSPRRSPRLARGVQHVSVRRGSGEIRPPPSFAARSGDGLPRPGWAERLGTRSIPASIQPLVQPLIHAPDATEAGLGAGQSNSLSPPQSPPADSVVILSPSPPDGRLVRNGLSGTAWQGRRAAVRWLSFGLRPLCPVPVGTVSPWSDDTRRAVMAVRSKLSGVAYGIATIGTNGENMPPQARLTQALYAVSRERQSLRVWFRRA